MCYFVSILVLQSYLVTLLCLSCWCIIVVWLFLTMRSVCLQFEIVVFPDHTHFLFLVKQQTGYHILIACSLCIKYIIYSRLNLGVYFLCADKFFSLPYPSKVVVLLLICCLLALPLFIWILHLALILKNST